MKILEKILISIGVILVILVVVAFLLPAKWNVQRSIVINAPISAIDPHISNLKKWPEWTPWNEKTDSSLKYTYEGSEAGTGAITKWTSNKMGAGILTITKAEPTQGIWYTMSMNNGKMPATGSITYDAIDGATKVTWSDSGELGNNPVNRYLGLLITPMLEVDLEKSLSNLKQIIEHENKEPTKSP